MQRFLWVMRGRHTASHPPSHDVTFRPRTVTPSRHVTAHPLRGVTDVTCDARPGIIDFTDGICVRSHDGPSHITVENIAPWLWRPGASFAGWRGWRRVGPSH